MSDQPSDPDRGPGPAPPGGPAGPGGSEPGSGESGRGDDLVGTVLAGRYRILRCLGEGAMGSVYLGEHLNFGRKDAIKVLHASMAKDPEATRRFLRGARNVSTINHPNVCTVYDFSDTDDGLQFLAMEFVEGETLSETLEREGALPVGRAVRIVEQVAAALQAAHDQGIVHRDLKPGNIMLARARDGSDRVKVVDFDIAKGSREGEGAEVTRMGFVVGTPEYMSPEQLTGDPLDGRSDIYSLALVFFRLLTDRLPLRSTTTQDLLVERLTQDPLPLRDVAPGTAFPPGIQTVLDRALQRRRDDRHPTAAAFAEDLARAVEEERTALPDSGGSPGATLVGPASRASRREGPPGPELPATRVTDPGRISPTPTSDGSPAPTEGGDGGARRLLAWGVGAVALVAVSWGGYVALSGEADTAGTELDTPADSTLIAGGPDDPMDPPGDQDTADVGDPGADTDDTGPDVGDPDAARDPADERVTPPDPPALPFPIDEAEDVAFRQLDRLDPEEPPPARILRAAADTAALILASDAVPRSSRAIAAFVLAQLRDALGDTAGAIDAMVRAVDLAPDNETYRNYLRSLRGGAP